MSGCCDGRGGGPGAGRVEGLHSNVVAGELVQPLQRRLRSVEGGRRRLQVLIAEGLGGVGHLVAHVVAEPRAV